MSDLSKAIDALADVVPGGHLLAATNGADLLTVAARRLTERKAEVKRLSADLAAARAERDDLAFAARWLLRLKEGTKDDTYRAVKDAAWDDLRAALAALPTTPKVKVVEDATVPPDAAVMRYSDKGVTITNLGPSTPEQEGTE